MIQYQILQTNILRIVWQTVRRIVDEILGVRLRGLFIKGLLVDPIPNSPN